MRSSSVKTTVATLVVAVTLIAAVPSAQARETRTKETAVAEQGLADRAMRAVERVMRRLTGGGVSTNSDLPSIPVPGGK